jgi:hypothetical protein
MIRLPFRLMKRIVNTLLTETCLDGDREPEAGHSLSAGSRQPISTFSEQVKEIIAESVLRKLKFMN